jgi:hypothetical protein
MADKNTYPQIPATVWWGMRGIFQRTPNATIDEKFLGAHLGVQEAAARQYVAELKKVGILTEEGKATPLAGRWRHNETYWDAVQEILKTAYPAGLLQLAPPEEADRNLVISWLTREGLGSGTAANKAATYLLIASRTPNEAPTRGASAQKSPADPSQSKKVKPTKPIPPPVQKGDAGARRIEGFPLNINVQIHISADATSDQIESIFAAMRRYLYENPNT